MPLLTLNFAGYGQCRLATDPDPTNEGRGVSGYTFALPGEPDLDWIIRTQPPAIERVCVERTVGVKVTGGFSGTQPIKKGHPLFDAKIELLDNPQYQERNYVVTTQSFGVIYPCHFNVRGRGVCIRRDVDFYPGQPLNTPVTEIPMSVLQPYTMTGFNSNVPECQDLLGPSKNPSVYRQERLQALLQYQRDNPPTPVQTAAINKRISELKINDPRDRRTFQLVNRATYNYLLNGPAQVTIGDGEPRWLNGSPRKDGSWDYTDPSRPLPVWPCQFWMGSWDADSLTFYMKGTVTIGDFGEIPGVT